jgi:hypothetical protein
VDDQFVQYHLAHHGRRHGDPTRGRRPFPRRTVAPRRHQGVERVRQLPAPVGGRLVGRRRRTVRCGVRPLLRSEPERDRQAEQMVDQPAHRDIARCRIPELLISHAGRHPLHLCCRRPEVQHRLLGAHGSLPIVEASMVRRAPWSGLIGTRPKGARRRGPRSQPSSDRAMIISWISVVPPPIDASFASRSDRSTWNSSM